MLFLIYFPAEDISSSQLLPTDSMPSRKHAVIVGITSLVTLVLTAIVSIGLVAASPKHTQWWASTLGTAASMLAAIQYIPQIWHTWKIGAVRSLSILTMLVQAPGSFLFAFSLWLRVGKDGWSTWLVYITTGTLQFILLGLAITYTLRERQKGEREPLLSQSSNPTRTPDNENTRDD